MPGTPEFYVVVWLAPTPQPDRHNLLSELYPSRGEALGAYDRLVATAKTKAQAFDSTLATLRSNAGSIGMSHVQHQHAARRILSELDEATLQRRRQTRRLLRGVVRATVQLLAAQRRAAERVYAPGATGYEEVRTSFESARQQPPYAAPGWTKRAELRAPTERAAAPAASVRHRDAKKELSTSSTVPWRARSPCDSA